MRVETYGDAEAFLAGYSERPVECLLLDLKLPRLDGLDLQRRLAERAGGLPVVIITGYGSTATAVEAMKLGAVDYVEKPFDLDALVATVRTALAKDREAKRGRSRRSEVHALLARLTAREREVLDLVVAGHPSREIADVLGLAKKTIDLHRSHIMAKLRAESVVDLVTMVLIGRRSRRQDPADGALGGGGGPDGAAG
jgi:two-component system, LuxR family, response regulator FixJ